MRIARPVLLSALLLPLSAPALLAQDATTASEPAAAPQTYKLTFTVTELVKGKEEGKRLYSALFAPTHIYDGSIRAQNRVPVLTGTVPINSNVSTQYTYQDVGVDIDFGGVAPDLSKGFSSRQFPLRVTADVTALAPTTTPGLSAPTLRDDRWKTVLVVTVDKPTLLFISDDPATDLTTRVDLTATLVPGP